jgi:hypothetical protein
MSQPLTAVRNVGLKIARRAAALPKRAQRVARRAERFREQAAYLLDEERLEREIAAVASGSGPIVAGPWLSEVGFEVLYWIPFLRWFVDRYRVDPSRVVAVSRGGVAAWYAGVAERYVEIFDHLDPATFAARNEQRRSIEESGGQKQSRPGAFDEELVATACREARITGARVCHPSLMYRLFRQFWFGNRALDFVLTHTRHLPWQARHPAPAPDAGRRLHLPDRFAAVKFYSGTALPDTPGHRAALRAIVAGVASHLPIVLLDTALGLDEHEDYLFDLGNVTSVRDALEPRVNLAIQTEIISRASLYVGTCGSLAWLAPMLGVETLPVYADDRLLVSHLFVARRAYRQMGAAPFTPVDLRALSELHAAS